jgi:hypothetical protein
VVIENVAAVEAAALDPAFLDAILSRHRGEAHALLARASQEWVAAGAPRYSDNETSCTAVLVGFLADILREGAASAFQIVAFLETGGWSADHLDGRADPDTVPRPDIAMFLGVRHDVKMVVECKRLLAPNSSATSYVKDGLERFLTGKYVDTDGLATMICFALDRSCNQAASDINDAIRERLDEKQVLEPEAGLEPIPDVYRSEHTRDGTGLTALHLLLDLQDRPEPQPRC